MLLPSEIWRSSVIAFGNVEEANGILLPDKNACLGLDDDLSLYTHFNPF